MGEYAFKAFRRHNLSRSTVRPRRAARAKSSIGVTVRPVSPSLGRARASTPIMDFCLMEMMGWKWISRVSFLRMDSHPSGFRPALQSGPAEAAGSGAETSGLFSTMVLAAADSGTLPLRPDLARGCVISGPPLRIIRSGGRPEPRGMPPAGFAKGHISGCGFRPKRKRRPRRHPASRRTRGFYPIPMRGRRR